MSGDTTGDRFRNGFEDSRRFDITSPVRRDYSLRETRYFFLFPSPSFSFSFRSFFRCSRFPFSTRRVFSRILSDCRENDSLYSANNLCEAISTYRKSLALYIAFYIYFYTLCFYSKSFVYWGTLWLAVRRKRDWMSAIVDVSRARKSRPSAIYTLLLINIIYPLDEAAFEL